MSAAPRRLPRVLGFFDVTVLAAASMGPAYSLASTMGPMVAAAGSRATLALAALTLVMLCVAIAFAAMTRFHPNAGSSYAWAALAFGPFGGAYAAWLLLLSNYFATMATALPAATYTLDLFVPSLAASPVWDAALGVVWIAASGALLYLGLRPTAFVTAAFLIAELVVLAASAGVAWMSPATAVDAAPPAPVPLGGVVGAMVLGIWMIDGWEVSASSSEESAGAAETPGRGGITGLLLTAAILLLAMTAYLRLAPASDFAAHQGDAMNFVAERLGGTLWHVTIVATVLVSTAATLWTTVLYLSRSVYAMGRDRLLPGAIGALDFRGVPRNSLLLVFLCVAGATALTGFWPSAASALNLVLNGTAVFLGALFVSSCCATIAALWNEPRASRASAFWAPLAGALALTAMVALDVAQSDGTTRAIELGGLGIGLPFALWRGAASGAGKAPGRF